MITITPDSMVCAQHAEITPWLEAHGVVAGRVYRLDVDIAGKTMTVHEYEFEPDGQMRAVDGEPVKRQPYSIDIGLAFLPWMTTGNETIAELVVRRDVAQTTTEAPVKGDEYA